MLCVKFGLNWPSGSGEEEFIFLISSMYFRYLEIEGVAIHLNNHESPSSKNALRQIWLKLAQWFWRKRFLNFVNLFSVFCNYLPLEKGMALLLNKLDLNLLHLRMLCAKFG